jgi:ABC-type Fe3+-hydroxamate transport system substrate-binding protein
MESIAELVNQKKLARRWLDDHERKAEEWRKLLKAKIGNRTVALCVCREHELRMSGARNIGHVFYRSLNLRPPEKIAKLMGQFPTGTGYTWTAISPDEIEQYESDYLFVAVEQESDRQRIKHWLDTRPAWSNHPAVRARRLYFLDWEKWMIYAPFVINQQLDEAGSLLAGGSPAGRI